MPQPDGRPAGLAALLTLLSGCGGGLIATVGPDYQAPTPPAARRWEAPQPDAGLAHRGDPSALKRWWDRFDDPALSRFLAAAQRESASVAEARSRIEQARAGRVGAEAAGLPSLDGKADANWSSFSFGGPPFDWNRYQVGLQSSWEVDLFGGVARQREAAQSQLEARTAAWHDARVAVAVEVADAYLGYRHCEVLMKIAEADAASRRESARLTEIAGRAGLRAPADVALANASAADGQEILLRQQGQCERSIKGLVALTGLGEAEVRHRLTAAPERVARLPEPPSFRIAGLPAQVLMQRPDVAAAERDVAEASAGIGVEEAKRYPKLSLSGNITPTLQSVNAGSLFLAQTWQVGPTLSLPLFDAGKRAADVEAARARYEASVSRFRSTVRTAAKEVEDALVRLRNAEQRMPEAHAAAEGYRANFKAMEQLYRAGFGSLIDAEASRRQSLTADRAVAELAQEQAAAWIALYRAAGGGWEEGGEPARIGSSAPPSPADRTEPRRPPKAIPRT
jgi:multidrug efflux system outer membrane protein